MTRKRRKKISAKKSLKRETKTGIFDQFKFTESYTSLILGAIVVLIAGILFISFAGGNRNMQTSSTKEEPKMEQQKSQDLNTSSTYTIKPGDDLWSISENVYQDGYKWIEIARMNKLENPGLIHADNKLIIPTIAPKKEIEMKSETPAAITEKAIENNSITGDTYTIKSGDNLWDVCVRAYGDGYRWVELAKVNNLENPDLIHSDNVLKIPRSP